MDYVYQKSLCGHCKRLWEKRLKRWVLKRFLQQQSVTARR